MARAGRGAAPVAGRDAAPSALNCSRATSVVRGGAARGGRAAVTLGGAGARAVSSAVTGPPGAGKSTLLPRSPVAWRAAADAVRRAGRRPHVDAVAAARARRPRTDRGRSRRRGLFIRSYARPPAPGGLAIPRARRPTRSRGVDVVVTEAVGVDAAQTAVAEAVDTCDVDPPRGDASVTCTTASSARRARGAERPHDRPRRSCARPTTSPGSIAARRRTSLVVLDLETGERRRGTTRPPTTSRARRHRRRGAQRRRRRVAFTARRAARARVRLGVLSRARRARGCSTGA